MKGITSTGWETFLDAVIQGWTYGISWHLAGKNRTRSTLQPRDRQC